jgi:hypothetical protein
VANDARYAHHHRIVHRWRLGDSKNENLDRVVEKTMNRKFAFALSIILLAGVAASAQSLGDAARSQKTKKAKSSSSRVWTNDDMQSVGAEQVAPENGSAADDTSKSAKKDTSQDDRKRIEAEWGKKMEEQKKKLSDLERELDLLDREHKLRAAAFYADAGLRLRDDRNWADQERKYQEDIASRKQQIQEAKQQLEDTKERARKAGVAHTSD